MKKLLSILAAVGLTATASTAVVACGSSNKDTGSDGIDQTAEASFATKTATISHTDDKAGANVTFDITFGSNGDSFALGEFDAEDYSTFALVGPDGKTLTAPTTFNDATPPAATDGDYTVAIVQKVAGKADNKEDNANGDQIKITFKAAPAVGDYKATFSNKDVCFKAETLTITVKAE